MRKFYVLPSIPDRKVRTIELKLVYPSNFTPLIAKVTFGATDRPHYRFGTWMQEGQVEDDKVRGILRLKAVGEGDIVVMTIDDRNPESKAWFVERDGMLRRLEGKEAAISEWYNFDSKIPVLKNEH